MMRLFRPKCAKEEHNSDDETTLSMQKSNRKSTYLPTIFPKLAPLNWVHLAILVAAISLIKLGVRFEMSSRFPSIPDPATAFGIPPEMVDKNLLDTDQFVMARARNSLDVMCSFGTRPAGSLAAEKVTVKWLVDELGNLGNQQKPGRHSNLSITVDQVSGFFYLGFGTSVYSNITNVLARLDPLSGDKNNTLLMNCHFDSFFEAIGASDDAVNCAIMLEILRALMSSDTPLNHSVIFLFNGAEENILQASHGFLVGTSKDGGYVEGAGHPWAKQIRTFVNLEAAGAGGREILFQTGPGAATSILLRAYASAAPYPFATVVGQEVFQAGLIPSDTDFRIFRDYGHLPGMDFAFYSNGFVYHSRYDTPDRIPNGTIQRAGSNWLALVKALASSDLSQIPPVRYPNEHSFEKLVYFDIFSLFLVVYPFKTVGLALNILAILGVFCRIVCRLFRERLRYALILVVTLFAHVFAIAIAVCFALLVATLIIPTPSSMFWFAKPWLIYPIYVLPALGAAFSVHALFFKFAIVPLCATADYGQKCKAGYDVSLDAALFVCSLGMIVFSAFSIATSYILLIWIAPPLLLAILFPLNGKFYDQWYGVLLIVRHLLLTIIPTVYFLYVTDILTEMFVPISSHDDLVINPEYFMVAIVLLVVAFLLIFHAPVIYLIGGNVLPIVGIVAVITGLMLAVVIFTPFGHPFSLKIDRADGVHVQRSAIQLTLQKMGRHVHSGLWFIPLNYNGIKPLNNISRKLDDFFEKSRTPCLTEDDIANNSFCDLANIFPLHGFKTEGSYWVDVDASHETLNSFAFPTVHQISQRGNANQGNFLIQFRLNCGLTPHCALFVTCRDNVHLVRWHFGDNEIPLDGFPLEKLRPPPWPERNHPAPAYFVMLRFGSPSSARKGLHILFLTMQVAAESETHIFDFKLASQYYNGSSSIEIPGELVSFMENLPEWHYTVPVTTLYSTYSF